jgi:hypothetical protein
VHIVCKVSKVEVYPSSRKHDPVGIQQNHTGEVPQARTSSQKRATACTDPLVRLSLAVVDMLSVCC